MDVASGFEPELSIGPRFRFAYIFNMVKMTPRYIDVDGYKYCEYFIPDLIRAAINYKPTNKDVFVATYPKCGTTWMIQKVMLILNKGKVPDTIEEYFSSCPFLEMLGPDEISRMPGPGCIKIHFPFNLTPYSPDAKYVYVARNPKDCCISFYHHTKLFPAYYFKDGTFDDFFDLFIEGQTDFNDYFDNLLSWYEHRNDPNVFFVTYEEMKKNPKDTIKKLAGFLGEEYSSALADNEELLDEIALKSSFEYMQKTTNNLFIEMLDRCEEYAENPNVPKGFKAWSKFNSIAIKDGQGSNGNFVRNGAIGDSKIKLSLEQEERLNKRIKEKTQGSDVMKLWENVE
ncbi:sulfotransferase 1C4 [Caerostris darwini]|uniref:Sulfotransferase 1C4 n=1 Tax=Caerostris darwini TaxID=1538125 RepID=A0AAV4U1G7_9ARAC|nr:sulfotransferase 1C4 [Caerostris darwini]